MLDCLTPLSRRLRICIEPALHVVQQMFMLLMRLSGPVVHCDHGRAWARRAERRLPQIIWLFIMGLPALFLGTWLGLRFYGRLDEARFEKIVLLLSGVALFLADLEASWRSRTAIAMLRLRNEQIRI